MVTKAKYNEAKRVINAFEYEKFKDNKFEIGFLVKDFKYGARDPAIRNKVTGQVSLIIRGNIFTNETDKVIPVDKESEEYFKVTPFKPPYPEVEY